MLGGSTFCCTPNFQKIKAFDTILFSRLWNTVKNMPLTFDEIKASNSVFVFNIFSSIYFKVYFQWHFGQDIMHLTSHPSTPPGHHIQRHPPTTADEGTLKVRNLRSSDSESESGYTVFHFSLCFVQWEWVLPAQFLYSKKHSYSAQQQDYCAAFLWWRK